MNNIASTDCLKLSVIVLTYNQENTIAQTLDSILQQKHNYSYEIVIGEDCSTDRTREILLEYQSRHPDVIRLLLNEKNLGLIGNYFNVIEHCRGEYIMQCAGDDWWLPGKVALQIPYMDNHPECGMCYTDAVAIHVNRPMQDRNIIFRGRNENTIESLLMYNHVVAPTIVLRRQILGQYQKDVLPVSQNWQLEDYPMWLWIAINSCIAYISESTVCYRISSGTVSRPHEYLLKLEFMASENQIKMFYINRNPVISPYIALFVKMEAISIQLQIAYIKRNITALNQLRRTLLRQWKINVGLRKSIKYIGLILFPGIMIKIIQNRLLN